MQRGIRAIVNHEAQKRDASHVKLGTQKNYAILIGGEMAKYCIDEKKLESLIEELMKASCLPPEDDYISDLIIDTDIAISLIRKYLVKEVESKSTLSEEELKEEKELADAGLDDYLKNLLKEEEEEK